MKQNRVYGDEYRRTILCVDSYEKSVPTGRFYNPSHEDGEPFQGLTEFLIKMEDILNSMDFPQSFTATRTFGRPPEYRADGPPETMIKEGKLATFMIRILFRQNASWQGSVTWLEGETSQSFRSVLELVLLMDSALRETEQPSDMESA